MSLKSKIEAVIYASEEPVTLQQLTGLLAEEAQAEVDRVAARQAELPLAELLQATAGEADGDPAPDQVPEGTPEMVTRTEETAETDAEKRRIRERERTVRDHLRRAVDELMRDYAESDRGIEVREVAGGFRMGTKPEYHDAVRGFVKSLKPALKLSLQALETLAVVAYKQPVTAAEISEIRGVDSAGVLGGLMTRKLIATAGRKQVIGRPMLYKTTREFLMRFGLKDVQELPSMEEFERMAGELTEQEDLPMESTEAVIERANVRGDAEHLREINAASFEEELTDSADDAEGVYGTETEELASERPSEELVVDVLGVSEPEVAFLPGKGNTLETAPLRIESQSSIEAGLESRQRDPAQESVETEPIEAAAAMQAQQTGTLVKEPGHTRKESGRTQPEQIPLESMESEPQ